MDRPHRWLKAFQVHTSKEDGTGATAETKAMGPCFLGSWQKLRKIPLYHQVRNPTREPSSNHKINHDPPPRVPCLFLQLYSLLDTLV
ncbi:hypothetical protein VTK56DRAFT_1212 [Thermocarpiscus australiensis]